MSRGTAHNRQLIIMAKAPRAGLVKTRLASEIGTAAATGLYRSMLASLLHRVVAPARWQTTLAIAPDWAVTDPVWPATAHRVGQGRGDLGARMQRQFDIAKPGPVLIIGSDIPGITRGHVARAFNELASSDAVFGPADDGGYWAIGLARRRPVRGLFDNVRWSTAHALADTLANLDGCESSMIDVLADVDTASDLVSSRVNIGRRVPPANARPAEGV